MSADVLSFDKQWGKSAHIDLTDCEHDRLTSAPMLEAFIKELIKKIDMVAHGPCYIDRFGSLESNLEGYSAMQFIETSAITVHLDEVGNRAYIDIFSCKNFAEQEAFDFAKEYFNAQQGKLTVLDR
ncbi:MAG: hypothetical protein A3D99_00965 [Candidatus Andersenbacteria bacterium RIFCSPHIGHO2_12_FULL_45_11]|uniref:S-adenosylmethionine decarboxylase n=1 Tax=Candidatus Andersenbacteria bacterium RIFCSPHIGHO2_12_FULL_45_11 TaxID=1797281 RepID=A0A1G1X5C9_9BACT|nr:MAG: hypothetical protein A3D99_00965 [Candidatus Andersenbacteria bacterium RIFCSPHIGHO2_12_FULL_45_11]